MSHRFDCEILDVLAETNVQPLLWGNLLYGFAV